MRHKLNLSLKQYLIAFGSIMVIVCSLTLLFLPAKLYESIYTKQAVNYCKNMAIQTSTGILNALYEFDRKIDTIVDTPALRQLITQRDSSESAKIRKYKNIVSEYFTPQMTDTYYMQQIDLYIKEDQTYLPFGSKPTALEQPFNSTYYSHALIHPSDLNWLGFNESADCLEISRLIYDYNTYEVLALFVLRFSNEYLMDKFETYNTIEIENMYISDDMGRILCAYDMSGIDVTANGDIPTSSRVGTFYSGDSLIVYCSFREISARFPYEDWNTCIVVNIGVLTRDFASALTLFCLLAIGIIGAGIFSSVKYSNRMVAPFNQLICAMNEAQQGHLSMSLVQNSHVRELDIVLGKFNEMAKELDTLINTVYKARLAQKEAELKALQSQINPHFLFNTLQLISWKAREYEAYPVCDMVKSLSYMLEIDLYSFEKQNYTLSDELEYIRHYAMIIDMKYSGKITVSLNVDDSLMNSRLPKLIVQPFIENAVVHGLAPKTCAGKVEVSAKREHGDLIIVIQDDGVGMHASDLDAILSPDYSESAEQGNAGHRIALRNIQNRIRLLYGESYGFEIDSVFFSGTTVKLRIPYEEAPGQI